MKEKSIKTNSEIFFGEHHYLDLLKQSMTCTLTRNMLRQIDNFMFLPGENAACAILALSQKAQYMEKQLLEYRTSACMPIFMEAKKFKLFEASYDEDLPGEYLSGDGFVIANTESEALGMLLEAHDETNADHWMIKEVEFKVGCHTIVLRDDK